ncbi:dienelactone hydrolase [Zychaea mexicana]|uniref:dienelactone hydrolase n=1 Tax=Zychaea mexicana TaxID=64656 RepID=UPI0022FE42DA|nr:dienelactone hydrolase [Zychaea mexicana]KAI9492302.1 dienelactone hydrolase [Zychaea mexicana]
MIAEAAKKLPFQVFPFKPKTTAKIPGSAIIVLQEWWGVDNQIKAHAQHLADSTGAFTVVPDLYKGKLGLTAEEASHLMSNLDWRTAIGELAELTDQLYAAKYRDIGSIGFCMGGGLSLALASRMADTKNPLKAAVTCYGTPPADIFDVRNITTLTAVQGHFGGRDTMAGFSDPTTADALEFNLKTHNLKDVEIFRYPEQGHAFLNDLDWNVEKRKELGFVSKDIDPKTAESDVRRLAWTRISNFFIQNLGGNARMD